MKLKKCMSVFVASTLICLTSASAIEENKKCKEALALCDKAYIECSKNFEKCEAESKIRRFDLSSMLIGIIVGMVTGIFMISRK